MRHQPGAIVGQSHGCITRYTPSQGSSYDYTTTCPHGTRNRARTQREARQDRAEMVHECPDCRIDREES